MAETGTRARRGRLRRRVGWVLAGSAALTLVLFVLGSWNPGDHVVLWQLAGNPFEGAVLVCLLMSVVLWLLVPIGDEARQVTRARWRIGFALGLVFSLIGWGLFGARFETATEVLAGDGRRTVVLYDPGTDVQRLHVWAGRGLGRTFAGDLGRPCGPTTARLDGDLVRVRTNYGDFALRLDPATGRPLDRLGPTCSG